MRLAILFVLVVVCYVQAWPGKGRASRAVSQAPVGPDVGPLCTVRAHGWWPDSGDCPNMVQPNPPNGTLPITHPYWWPLNFIVDWEMYFVPDGDDTPPYEYGPKTDFNKTTGRTWYKTYAGGGISMRESYDKYCIPVFGDPTNPMGNRNDYSCDFINSYKTNTAYVVLHDDRPEGTPTCCIIGYPFHAPPPDFSRNMPLKWLGTVGTTHVAWHAVYDKDAGIFNYGFDADTSVPFAFYMTGVPWLANWCWQKFDNFSPEVPEDQFFDVPTECEGAIRCPGW